MVEARRLPILKYISTLLNPILQYFGQMPSNDYCDMIIQAWAPAIPNIIALEAQSKKKSFTKQNDNVQSSQPASNILQPM
ncbi:5227_t:CDS:2, partial [Dentiscutata heterogama]